MKDKEILIECMKLDGYVFPADEELLLAMQYDPLMQYLTFRDAIIPVIEKQCDEIKAKFMAELYIILLVDGEENDLIVDLAILFATARQLCIALLKACDKWK